MKKIISASACIMALATGRRFRADTACSGRIRSGRRRPLVARSRDSRE